MLFFWFNFVENSIQYCSFFLCIFKSKFKRLNVNIVYSEIDCSTRRKHLNDADLIVYMCASAQELKRIEMSTERKLSQPNNSVVLDHIQIGQNTLNDEFNQLHYVKKFSSKCIDLCVNLSNVKQQTRRLLYALVLGKSRHLCRTFDYNFYYCLRKSLNTNKWHDSNSGKSKNFFVLNLIKTLYNKLNKAYLLRIVRRIESTMNKNLKTLLNNQTSMRRRSNNSLNGNECDDDEMEQIVLLNQNGHFVTNVPNLSSNQRILNQINFQFASSSH